MTKEKSTLLLCTCGKQLQLDYDLLEGETRKLETASSVVTHDVVCQEDGLAKIADLLEKGAGRLVIAACTSQKIQPRIDLFLESKGIDASQIQYVNIREHSDWVHQNKDEATKKSFDMVRGALARSILSSPENSEVKEVQNHVTVIGGGIAGIESSLSLSNLGYKVTIIEREDQLGGHVIHLPVVAPTGKSGKEVMSGRLEALMKNENITVMTNTHVKFFEGEMGDFTLHYISNGEDVTTLKTSAVVMASGFKNFKPTMM